MQVVQTQELYHKPDAEHLASGDHIGQHALAVSSVDSERDHQTHIDIEEHRESLCPHCFPEKSTVED